MTLAEALDIYEAFTSALEDVAADFFIAGIDYDEDYSNPNKSEYIASFFAREDTILSDHNWSKLYSPDEGLGRINRNLEGIPTANFWDLDFTDAERAVEYHELDDGTDIFIRAPKEWWETYTVSTLGNDRTDSDSKTLQYVGNVDTYDETVGYVRQVAQLEYTQEWSWTEYEGGKPSNPDVGDQWVADDYDDAPARWVVTYREDAHPDWTDEYTAYEQYSIFDGRETDEAILPYVVGIFTGLFGITADAVDGDAVGGTQQYAALLEGIQTVPGLAYVFAVTGDQSVKVPWTPTEWDLGDAGAVDDSGKLIYSIEAEGGGVTYYETTDSNSLNGADDLPGNPGGSIFEGNNWDFGIDANGPAGLRPEERRQRRPRRRSERRNAGTHFHLGTGCHRPCQRGGVARYGVSDFQRILYVGLCQNALRSVGVASGDHQRSNRECHGSCRRQCSRGG